jgi:hypothetical protein
MRRSRPVSLSASFEARYVAGRIIWLLPVLSAILLLAWRIGSLWLPLFFAKYGLILLFVGWSSKSRANEERASIERYASDDIDFARFIYNKDLKIEFLFLFASGLLTASILSFSGRDARVFLLVAWVIGLIGVGSILKWLVYDRWIVRELRRVELHIFRQSL